MRVWLRRTPIAGRSTRRRGSIMVLTLWALTFVAGLSAAGLSQSVSEISVTERYREFQKAFQAAEAGLDAMIVEKVPLTHEMVGNTLTPLPPARRPKPKLPGASIDDASGTYRFPLSPETSVSVLTFADPSNASVIRIQSTGRAGNANSPLSHTLEVYAIRSDSPFFPYASFAIDGGITTYRQAMTDSYDSRQGRYNPNSPGQKGDIGMNCPDCSVPGSGRIQLRGETVIHGTVLVGPGGDASLVQGTGTITGTPPVQVLSALEAFPPITLPSECHGAQNRNLVVRNSNVVLPAGTSCFNRIDLRNSSVTFSGKATVYVLTEFKAFKENTFSAESFSPADLQMIVNRTNPGQTSVALRDQTKFYGTIYAPKTGVMVGNDSTSPQKNKPTKAELFGAVVAKFIQIANPGAPDKSAIHYDEALKESGPMRPTGGSVKVVAWSELK